MNSRGAQCFLTKKRYKKKREVCIFIFVSALITVKQNYRTCDQVLAELENKWSNFSIWGLSEAKNVRSEARISDFFWSSALDQEPSLRLIENPHFAWSKTLAALNRKPSLRSIENSRCARIINSLKPRLLHSKN